MRMKGQIKCQVGKLYDMDGNGVEPHTPNILGRNCHHDSVIQCIYTVYIYLPTLTVSLPC